MDDRLPRPLSKFFLAPKSKAESELELECYQNRNDFISTLPRKDDLYCYRGFWFRHDFLLGILSFQKHFKACPSDIFVQTYMKSGTTWIRALVFAIVNRRSVPYKDHPLLSTHPQFCAAFLDGLFSVPQLPNLEVLPHPRLLASHCPYSLLPDFIKNCRMVYMRRDPKDTLISMWHYLNDIRSPTSPFIPLSKIFEDFCNGVSRYGPIWEHHMEYKNASLSRPDKVLFLEYEEMKANPDESVRKIAEFLGEAFTEEEEKSGAVQEIVRLCGFQFLKELEVNKVGIYFKHGENVIKNSSFFRKGEVGDWKEHLTQDMADRIDQITREKFRQYDLI